MKPGSSTIGVFLLILGLLTTNVLAGQNNNQPDLRPAFTNSIGMSMVRIDSGKFRMGSEDGDIDEEPVHDVTISTHFYMGAYEVTNAEYEQFDPTHKELRSKLEFSKDDDEAVVFVSWEEANAFTHWLAKKEGLPYRLPTEAEWEYAARAGTTTPYYWGAVLPEAYLKNPKDTRYPEARASGPEDIVPLHVGKAPPNRWGLYDMHGNVQEWVADWFGPYEADPQIDPVGRIDGDFRVTRGGSHSQIPYFLRSANRGGTISEDRTWLIGFRIVIGEVPDTKALPVAPPACSPPVEGIYPERKPVDSKQPFFRGPVRIAKPNGSIRGPFFLGNQQVHLVEASNGDIIAVWSNGNSEVDRKRDAQTLLSSRLRSDSWQWGPACVFWEVPDRWGFTGQIQSDSIGNLYNSMVLSAGGWMGNQAIIWRTSSDNGETWSKARFFWPEHGNFWGSVWPGQLGELFAMLHDNNVSESRSYTSRDGGESWGETHDWANLADSRVLLEDGSFMNIDNGSGWRATRNVPETDTKPWSQTEIDLPRRAAQQHSISDTRRLNEGPLIHVSYADDKSFQDSDGNTYRGTGLFATLSYDEGMTWPVRRLLTDGDPPRFVTEMGNKFILSPWTAEPVGHRTVLQTRDGMIHVASSLNHYAFNLAWLLAKPSTVDEQTLPSKTNLNEVITFRDYPSATQGRVPVRYVGVGSSEVEAVQLTKSGRILLNPKDKNRVAWRLDLSEEFSNRTNLFGVTIELRVQVRQSQRFNGCYIMVQLPSADGPVVYHVSITPDAILHWKGVPTTPFVMDLDNASELHTYRIAIDSNGLMRVFRDGKFLGHLSPFVWKPHPSKRPTDSFYDVGRWFNRLGERWVEPENPFLQFGVNGSANVTIESFSYDLTGAFSH
jgi:formylglycine-generating enzyme required for sulfatase activity